MLQATILDGELFDLFPFFHNSFSSPEVDIRRWEVVRALKLAFFKIKNNINFTYMPTKSTKTLKHRIIRCTNWSEKSIVTIKILNLLKKHIT